MAFSGGKPNGRWYLAEPGGLYAFYTPSVLCIPLNSSRSNIHACSGLIQAQNPAQHDRIKTFVISASFTGNFEDNCGTFPDATAASVEIKAGDAPEGSSLPGSAVLDGQGSIDLGRIYMTHGTLSMWIKPEEVQEDGRILGQLPLSASIKAIEQTVTTKEGQEVDITLTGEGEGLTVNAKAVLGQRPDSSKGYLAQMPDKNRINGTGATVTHPERKASQHPKAHRTHL